MESSGTISRRGNPGPLVRQENPSEMSVTVWGLTANRNISVTINRSDRYTESYDVMHNGVPALGPLCLLPSLPQPETWQMNIFILDDDPKQAAIWHCDQHIQSAVKEFSQMLACMFTEEQLKSAPLTQNGTIRKHSYYNHPCTRWLRESKENYNWGFSQLQQILIEFACRFGSIPNARFFNWVNKNISLVSFPTSGRTRFATAFTEGSVARWCLDTKKESDPVELYKIYYVHDKPFATWSINKPHWI